jgi:hypothetical protein
MRISIQIFIVLGSAIGESRIDGLLTKEPDRILRTVWL